MTGAVKRGYDVLLCTQDVDEFMFQAMRTYHMDAVAGDAENAGVDARDLELANVSTADLDLATDEEKQEAEKATKDNEGLFDAMAEALGEKVSAVRVSANLTDAPACITTEGPISLEMERVMMQGPDAGMAPRAQRVLELNASHPVFDKLVAAQEAETTTSSPCTPVCCTTRRCWSRVCRSMTRWSSPRTSAPDVAALRS